MYKGQYDEHGMNKGLASFKADIWDPEENYEVRRLEGWLEKKGDKGVFLKGKKKRRFFRTFVDDGIPVLFYYETDNVDAEPKGSIDFRTGTFLYSPPLFTGLKHKISVIVSSSEHLFIGRSYDVYAKATPLVRCLANVVSRLHAHFFLVSLLFVH